MKHSSIALALASTLALTVLAGCDQKASVNEAYVGVPKDGKTCEQAYQLPANVTKCVGQDSRH